MHFPSPSKKLLGIFSVFFIFFVVGVAYAGGLQILNMTMSNADLHAAADGINFFDFDTTTDVVLAPIPPNTGELNVSYFTGPGSIRMDKNTGEPAVLQADPLTEGAGEFRSPAFPDDFNPPPPLDNAVGTGIKFDRPVPPNMSPSIHGEDTNGNFADEDCDTEVFENGCYTTRFAHIDAGLDLSSLRNLGGRVGIVSDPTSTELGIDGFAALSRDDFTVTIDAPAEGATFNQGDTIFGSASGEVWGRALNLESMEWFIGDRAEGPGSTNEIPADLAPGQWVILGEYASFFDESDPDPPLPITAEVTITILEPGPAPFCEPSTKCVDSNECTIDSCDEVNDTCINDPDEGEPCGIDGTCDANGDCVEPVLFCESNPCNDNDECTLDICDEVSDSCLSIIDEGAICEIIGTCDANGDCVLPVPLFCEDSPCDDSNECTIDSCNEDFDSCTNEADVGASCADGICDANGDCVEVKGDLIQVIFGGEVTEVIDDGGVLSGSIPIGAPYHIMKTYEFDTPDGKPLDTGFGSYQYLDIHVDVNGVLILGNAPAADPDDDICFVVDGPVDVVGIVDSTLVQLSDLPIDDDGLFLDMQLIDPTGTALDDDSLTDFDLFDLSLFDEKNVIVGSSSLTNAFVTKSLLDNGQPLTHEEMIGIAQLSSFMIIGNVESISVIDDGVESVVGGEIIPIETTSLILAGSQSFSWMIPLVLSGIGIGIFIATRKSEKK
jgi:hypothetical protein